MRIECVKNHQIVTVLEDICYGCQLSKGRPTQIIQGTDGKIDACIVCRKISDEPDREQEGFEVIRSGQS